METFARSDGGFGTPGGKTSHVCVTANTARALVKFGYEDDRRIRSAFDWLVEDADPKGGWSCYGSGRLLDTWEPLSAFAALPKARWTASARSCVERGAEFFLQRELHRQGDRYEPWFRTHYPVHYYYDMLVGLDCLTALGCGSDPRLDFALAWLRKLRRRDGRWNLDGVHPERRGWDGRVVPLPPETKADPVPARARGPTQQDDHVHRRPGDVARRPGKGSSVGRRPGLARLRTPCRRRRGGAAPRSQIRGRL